MKILVTGASGFIGRNLCEALSKEHFVIGIGSKDAQIKDIEYHKIDITDYSSLEKLFQLHKFDVIYHLASVTFHDDIVNRKQNTLNISLRGSENLVILVNKYCNNAKFVYSSTGKVYGGGIKQPIDEYTPVNPTNPLGKSKYITERVIDYYSGDNPSNRFIIFRIFNVYGYGQRDSFVIPHIIGHVKENKVIPLGNLEDYRDYIYIKDLIDCMISVIENDKTAENSNIEIYNIGSGKAYCVKDILTIIEKLIGKKIEIRIKQEKIRKDETSIEYSDSNKAKKAFNWEVKTSLETGLKEILNIEGLIK